MKQFSFLHILSLIAAACAAADSFRFLRPAPSESDGGDGEVGSGGDDAAARATHLEGASTVTFSTLESVEPDHMSVSTTTKNASILRETVEER